MKPTKTTRRHPEEGGLSRSQSERLEERSLLLQEAKERTLTPFSSSANQVIYLYHWSDRRNLVGFAVEPKKINRKERRK